MDRSFWNELAFLKNILLTSATEMVYRRKALGCLWFLLSATHPTLSKFFSYHMTFASRRIFNMASQSQGIQQLLQAEKKAETMVSDARKRT